MKLPCHKPAPFVRPFRQKLVADADVVKLQDLHLYVQQATSLNVRPTSVERKFSAGR